MVPMLDRVRRARVRDSHDRSSGSRGSDGSEVEVEAEDDAEVAI